MYTIKDEIKNVQGIKKDLFIEVDVQKKHAAIRESDEPDGRVPVFPESSKFIFGIPKVDRKHRKAIAKFLVELFEEELDIDEIIYELREYVWR